MPLELFDIILVHAVHAPTLSRAFRFRLVNRPLRGSICMKNALLLSASVSTRNSAFWGLRRRSLDEAGSFGIGYVARRVLRTDPNIPYAEKWRLVTRAEKVRCGRLLLEILTGFRGSEDADLVAST